MTKEVYAFTGKRGSGKSTAVSALTEMGYKDAKFADPLKNMLRAFYETCGFDLKTIERKIEGDLKEVPCEWLMGKTPRFAQQTLGTEWRDMINVNLWANILEARIDRGDFGDKIAISDYRFPEHEGDTLKRLGAVVYRIERSDQKDDEYSAHASEASIKDTKVSGVILNDGTIEDLKTVIRELVRVNEAAEEVVNEHDGEDALAYY